MLNTTTTTAADDECGEQRGEPRALEHGSPCRRDRLAGTGPS